MDRISALRNIEEALSAFEREECTLPELEREVRGILRTYATEFDDETRAYRARGPARVDGLVVLATSRQEARDRIADLLSDPPEFSVEPADDP
ncbi:hypothetical protein [Salinibaculum salinum]|uniref:DUF7854 family protein n=1 Tax=Salinibaculum salinum TaxID=3131996 RepID=UPI0030EBB8D5